jgi:tetratricopeptide (TPR) repeat protein
VANLFEHKDRRVVPNWRSFGKTTVLGELNSIQAERTIQTNIISIDDYIIDWKNNKTVIHAADLMSAGLVNNFQENNDVIEAANFVIHNSHKATFSQISLANKILKRPEIVNLSDAFKTITFDNFTELINPAPIQQKIRETKETINFYPYNPILYVELSRYYSILGNREKAIKAMKTALHLSSNNRFVLRSATRLFAHYDELEIAHDILRKSPLTNHDPWLTSAEISIATIRNRNSTYIKKGIELINSKNISPFNFTELASSIGTVELLNGSLKKSREFFNKSLINPNDNSLAQVEWASIKENQLNLNASNYIVGLNFEALALDNFQKNEYALALDNAAKWFMDMPFSKRPIMFGSNLASTILKDQEKSISFLNAGLHSHPNDPQLINNLAYALALDNRAKEAFDQLNKIKNENLLDEMTKTCLLATRGLATFRSGFPDFGRKLYLEAIERTKKANNQSLNWVAILNYAREEIRVASEFVEPIMEVVNKIPSETKEIEVNVLRNDILAAYELFKQSGNK